jgi:hypothetical protein
VVPRPLRLLIHDATCGGGRGRPGLSHAWGAGAWLHRGLDRFDAAYGASSWADALEWLACVTPGAPIEEVQYWGHGRWGRALIADDVLDVSALEPGHRLHEPLVRIRARLVPDGRALWWWRTCETFGADAGHELAIRWTRFFNCTSAGHTHVIGVWQSGLHVLRPGEAPDWSPDEGLREGTPAAPIAARSSRPGAPHTITCFRSRIDW